MKSTDLSNIATNNRLHDHLTGASKQPTLVNLGRQFNGNEQLQHDQELSNLSKLIDDNWNDNWNNVDRSAFEQTSTDLRSSWNLYRTTGRLIRSRSMIRTNPWIGSTGDSPPRSPGQTPPYPMCRSWSTIESGKASPRTKALRSSFTKFAESSDVHVPPSSMVYSRQDSLLTTSIETDSVCYSEVSDSETTASQLSMSDSCFTSTESDHRLKEIFSYDRPLDVGLMSEGDVHRRSSHDDPGVSLEGDKFLMESLNSEKSRKRLRHVRGIPCVSEFGLKRPNVEENSTEPIREAPIQEHPGSVQTTIDTSDRVQEDNEIPMGPSFLQLKLAVDTKNEDNPGLSSSQNTDPSAQFRRKILAVRSSLQDKVSLLRHEKKVVDQKIREAKEEEKLRLRQLEKFRLQLSHTRKEILLRTLEDIRRQLSQQALRLQNLYDFVLVEQRQIFCCQ